MDKINEIIVLDIETTGFQNQNGLIVEVGMVLLNLETGNVTPIYNELVKENEFNDSHKDAWIFSNSDLSFDNVSKAKPLDKSTIQNFLDKYHATAYNKSFDFNFLKSRGLKINELPCPMMLSTDICKLPGRYGSYKWPKVQEAYDHLFGKTDYVETHRGCDDAIHEAAIVYKLYQMGVFKIDDLR